MSYQFYLILHLAAVLALAVSLGAFSGLLLVPSPAKRLKIFLFSLHGTALFLAFLAGFGLIAKTQIPFPYPFWIYAKMGIWILLGFAPFFIRKIRALSACPPSSFFLTMLLWLVLLLTAVLLVRL